MFSQIFRFFLISCVYSQINCAPIRNRDEDNNLTNSLKKASKFIFDKVENNMNNIFYRAKNDKNETKDAKRLHYDKYEIDNDREAEITDNVKYILEAEFQKQVDFVADKVQDATNIVEETKNIVNKFYETGIEALKNTGELVRNSLDKSIQSAGEIFDKDRKSSKNNLETLYTIVKTPLQQGVNIASDFFG